LGCDKVKLALLALFSVVLAGVSRGDVVQGRAEIIQWNADARIVVLCDTQLRFQLGIFTSNAAGGGARDVERWLARQPGPLLVDLVGFPASLPSGRVAVPGVAGVLSVGQIRPLAYGSCS
jgi:hypothetical protein